MICRKCEEGEEGRHLTIKGSVWELFIKYVWKLMGIIHQTVRDEKRSRYDSIIDGVDGNQFKAETWWKLFPSRSEHISDGNYFIAERKI